MATVLRTLVSRALALAATAAVLLLLGAPAWAAPEKVAGGIRFTYRDANASAVFWAGAFNNWSTSAAPLVKGEGGVWGVVIALPAGEQAYKFVVDGQWFADPENSVTSGEYGNSVVKIGADGALVTQAATSNTAYSPKITIDGRVHNLMLERFDAANTRYELNRPTFDIDLGFGIRLSDLLKGRVLTNIDPQKEDVQDYRSRLNFKRGSLDFVQPDLRIVAFDSETLPTWDDPARLVGDIGVYHHPFGDQQNGFEVSTPKLGFDTRIMYSDNGNVGGTEFPGAANINDYSIDRGTNRKFVFESDAYKAAYTQFRTARVDTARFRLVPGQLSRYSTTDIGDGGHSFGFGDGAINVFATSIRRPLPGGLLLGVLGRADRGFNLGRLVLAEVVNDSTATITYGQTEQQWFAAGGEARWTPGHGITAHAEYLQGARRLDMMDRASRDQITATAISGTGIAAVRTLALDRPLGQHYLVDRGGRAILGGSWTLAEGDVGLYAEVERQTHRYPAWTQPPVAPAGLANPDHVQFENVDFQRGLYAGGADLENRMLEWRLRWDRNWRYYLGREVKSSLGLDMTTFTYDPRTTWEYQLWFPTGNFWLQQDGQVVSVDRLTLLGEKHAYRLRPAIDVPIRRARNVDFHYRGDYTGTKLSMRPRYAESIFQFGFDITPALRFTNDSRWVKYDAPALKLSRAYFSQFSEVRYSFSETITVGLGWGVDPTVLDPVTNEFAPIGREEFLGERNANGYVAQRNWLSLAPQIAAAEKALQLERRVQFEAVVHF
jgi:hypothetical protein